ncbi:DnaJ domain-containing protein [Rhizobium sp. XQZ8]|uniref:DnaJ C-terminal domain-containing protein n=1 Tax=Rhizobium populisoli TaxID=2859785 RepID=UPI001CA49413|nr:DnaJ C-terminal domain-containing protein [Rhizobium populisoli]MBW6426016.1 DnaJ domain-containing protein [Rhizobium populisoli]
MASPYETLGVKKDASQKEIQSVYRKLAKKYHPDLNPGDSSAEQKFKSVSAAYAILEDEDKRAKFDRGEIDENGVEQAPRKYYREYAQGRDASGRYRNSGGFADFGDGDDLFSSFFSGARGRRQQTVRGDDLQFKLEISLLDAANGGPKTVTLPGGSTLELRIPPGVRDGQVLRLRGKGSPGFNGGPDGDALVEIQILPHRQFVRDGDNVQIEVPISVREAVLGGKIEVPTLSGAVSVTVPANTSTGRILRLSGKGFPNRHGGHGDQFVTLKIVLPSSPDPQLEEFMRGWEGGRNFNPRRA